LIWTSERKVDCETTNRREFLGLVVGSAAIGLVPASLQGTGSSFLLRYIVASSMYGRLPIADVLREVRKTGAEHIDIWPERHANHREQIEAIGHQRFAAMLRQHKVKVGILTHYDLSPFDLQAEMQVAKKFGGSMIICGSRGPRNLKGNALKSAIRQFIDRMKPHVAVAEQIGVTIGIENHSNSLIQSPGSIRWFADLNTSAHLGIALAPYHLPQDSGLIANLIRNLGQHIVHFYAWQYGMGCHKKLPKEQELLQLPGRGKLDFTPIVASLRKINYKGWTEVFMHAVPRGIPIMPTATEVSTEINRAKQYLEKCLRNSA
jgi:sugar phosphate isomerase/epimerase